MGDLARKHEDTAMSVESIDAVRRYEAELKALPDQVDLDVEHLLHGGVYTRTVFIPKGVTFTGAHIIVPTTLIIRGSLAVHTDDGTIELSGYHIMPASKGRKMAALALEDTHLTAIMATQAKTIEEVEREATDEPGNVATVGSVFVTGE